MRVAIALSVLVHGAGITWFAAREATVQLHGVLARVALVPPMPPSTELAVVFLGDETTAQFGDGLAQVAPRPRESQVVATAPRPGRAQVVAGARATPSELAPKPAEATEPKKKLSLTMRSGPEVHRPGSDGISDAMLEQMVNGQFDSHIANLPGAREDAAYERANARLHDRRWVERATADDVTAARFERMAAREAQKDVELVAQKDGTYTSDKTTFRATVNPDGTVKIDAKPNWQWKSVFHAEFDLTAALAPDDAYASAKRAYLDRTREQRVEIGRRYRSSQLARSAQIMSANLARLWATVTDLAERKELLFALWDECAESGDDELVEAGAEARRLVINFIHVRRIVYSAAELAALDARKQSRARFAP